MVRQSFCWEKKISQSHDVVDMAKLGPLDLEMIRIGMAKNGTFDENDIAGSDLKRLGTGKILDLLASLRDRKMLESNNDGSFSVTPLSRDILWDNDTPATLRMLRTLEIRPCSAEEMHDILGISHDTILEKAEELRRDGLILMSPLRRGDSLVKMYEILPEGIDAKGTLDSGKGTRIINLIDEIKDNVQNSTADTNAIIRKLGVLRGMLDEN